MGNEQDVPEVILDDGDQNLMGISETLWDGSGNGNANADGCNLYGNDSKEEGQGVAVQTRGVTMWGRHDMTAPKGKMEYLGKGHAKKQTERETGKHFVTGKHFTK